MEIRGGAIGLVEFNVVSRGFEAADAMVKRARVELAVLDTTCPGKLLAVVFGEVASVRAAVEAGEATALEAVVESVVVPNVHPDVYLAILGAVQVDRWEAIGVIETFSASSAVEAADSAVKAATVRLVAIRLATGLGGRGTVLLTGDVAAVRAAVEAGAEAAKRRGALLERAVIASPHPQIVEQLR